MIELSGFPVPEGVSPSKSPMLLTPCHAASGDIPKFWSTLTAAPLLLLLCQDCPMSHVAGQAGCRTHLLCRVSFTKLLGIISGLFPRNYNFSAFLTLMTVHISMADASAIPSPFPSYHFPLGLLKRKIWAPSLSCVCKWPREPELASEHWGEGWPGPSAGGRDWRGPLPLPPSPREQV